MKAFYKYLARGQASAAALAMAKRDILRTFGSRAVPFYWAGFTIEGLGDRSINIHSGRQEL